MAYQWKSAFHLPMSCDKNLETMDLKLAIQAKTRSLIWEGVLYTKQ